MELATSLKLVMEPTRAVLMISNSTGTNVVDQRMEIAMLKNDVTDAIMTVHPIPLLQTPHFVELPVDVVINQNIVLEPQEPVLQMPNGDLTKSAERLLDAVIKKKSVMEATTTVLLMYFNQ